jgi:hypothetical protein
VTDPNIKNLAVLVALLILAPLFSLYYGWVLVVLWRWFAVPLLPDIPWHTMVGIIFLIRIVAQAVSVQKPSKEGDVWEPIAIGVIQSLFALGLGFVLHCMGIGAHP